ncbi:NAD(P)H-dependent oxidoreductase [Cupriavidus sp. amp6]|uniref:FMN-dependent NADH-azoreductase n=1 Tax=unclassified Cupriavidus TaxID=2640874 RepID=UPI000412795F|nr:NAD(P)H-dependent oxidoreductase [Cupriavidus sp. amp6]MBP0633160.1 NAD(P)H-dependent oxidoreductase [Cupriavidus sp. AcVe19-1a]
MTKILHIVGSPRENSQSRMVAQALLETYTATRANAQVDTLDLWQLELPEMREDVLNAKYAILARREHTPAQAAAWETVQREVGRLREYDVFLFSVPMWNWGLPYRLKHYIDVITQPGLTFKWTPERGYEGLVLGRRAVVIYASSFDYSAGTPLAPFDHQKPYMEDWLRMIGVDDIETITFGPTHPDAPAMPASREQALGRAAAIAGVL